MLVLGVADLAGMPVAEQRISVNGAIKVTGPDGSVEVGPASAGKVEVALEAWPGLRRTLFLLEDGTLWPAAAPLETPPAEVAVRVEPSIPVNVRISVAGRSVKYWVEDPRGNVLPRRDVLLEVTGGTAGPKSEKDGRTLFNVQLSGPFATVSVADAQTGVTALAEVRP
jgi:hypothetical protein